MHGPMNVKFLMNVRFDLLRTDVHLTRKEDSEYKKILHGIM